ncbi:MAG: PQQ-binding-like beta-propeller repeat protein [Candidatus Bathyarchaeota archaeon]|nr:PQQ-binding-like beta-propeller repeat protein [Candidatus Bathyarchaeota archaeon]
MNKKAVAGMMLVLLVGSIVCMLRGPVGSVSAFSGGEDWWAVFHHDPAHTGFSNSTVPSDLCLWWDTGTSINGSVRSSPAAVGGRVFVGSSDKKLYVLNATTGAIIWSYSTGGAVESSPAVDEDGRVWVGSMNGSIYALNATKTTASLIWKFSTPTKGAIYSSPTVAAGIVYFGSLDGYVYALDAAAKTEKWRFWTACPVFSSPAVSGSRIFVGASDGRVYALSLTGRVEWFFNTGQNCSSSPTMVNSKVFVGSDNGKVYALDETTGAHIWNFTTQGKVKSSPAVVGGMVFVGSDDSRIYALNETTGTQIWNYTTGGAVRSSPAIADGRVFVGSGDSKLYILNASRGNLILNYATEGPVCSSPAVAQKMVFAGSDDKKVYAFGAENKPPQPIIAPPKQPSLLQRAYFNGSSSYDPDGGIVNCTWNFGDGSAPMKNIAWSIGKVASHIYMNAGEYVVTLTVTDSHPIPAMRQTKNTSLAIQVNEAWPMYRHDWNHTGGSTSLAPSTNGLLWSVVIGPDASTDAYMYPSPAAMEGTVYIASTNGKVHAINATNGSIVWSEIKGSTFHASPALSNGVVFIGEEGGHVLAIHACNGTNKWITATYNIIYSSPTVAYSRVFIGSGNKIYALDENTGSIQWSYDIGGQVYSSPAVYDGKVYVGSWNGKVYVLNATTNNPAGELVKTSGFLLSGIRSSPAVAYGRVFVGTYDGKIYCLDATSLNELWTGGIKIGNRVDSSPAVSADTVYVGSANGTMYAFSFTGALKWKNSSIGSVGWSSPAIADDKVFFGSTNGTIYALNAKNGMLVWSSQTGGPADSSPAIFNETLYVASKDGKLYAFWEAIHDVAITSVTRSPFRVDPGGTVNINVTVENQGTYDEANLNVTVYYSNATYICKANSTVIPSLFKRDKTTVPLLWNTLGVANGTYTITANVTIEGDNDLGDNVRTADGTVTIGGYHDINITDAWLGYDTPVSRCRYKTVVGQGYNATVWVKIQNEGDFPETSIQVTAYWSNSSHISQIIKTRILSELPVNGSATISILWDTASIVKGNYTIHVKAEAVPGESETSNNVKYLGYSVLVSIPGDINADRQVDLKDVFSIANAYDSRVCESKWNPNCDMDNDGVIDLKDYLRAVTNFGKLW